MDQLDAVVAIACLCWLFRTAIVLIFAWKQKQQYRPTNFLGRTIIENPNHPSVSILIPAYNEERTIARCMLSCIACHDVNKEIIVIDDGSTDSTSHKAKAIQALHPECRIRVIRFETNKGKTAALNHGLQQAFSDFIVTLDSDTTFTHGHSLHTLITPLIHQEWLSGATANLHLSHPHEALGMVQRIEYTKVLNSSKRAQSLLQSILILPGAMSAFRKDALVSIGGFSARTLAEDADATMELLSRGHQLVFQSDCIGITEGPHSLKDLVGQRLRWRIGQMQCLFRHPQLLWISPAKALFYIDMAITNTISALTPCITFLIFNRDLSKSWMPLMLMTVGCIAADLVCTAFAFRLDGQTMPTLKAYVLYFSFFALFSPIITWAAISHLVLDRTMTWHTSARY